MSDSISNGGCCSGTIRPGTYGNAVAVAQVTVDKCGRITKISNVAISGGGGGSSQWTGVTGSPIYYVPYVGIGSSSTPTANLQVTGNVYVSESLTVSNIYGNLSYLENNSNYFILNSDGTFVLPNNQLDVGSNSLTIKTQSPFGFTWDWNDGSGSLSEVNINSGGVNFDVATPSTTSRWYFNQDGSSVFPNNIYASNALTTANVHVTNTIDVLGSMTANAANATFFFDTFTIPYINTQYLNVASNIVLTGNLSAPLANITTLNVNYLTVNSAVVYGTSTLNVYGVSNLSTATLTGKVGQTTLNVTGNVYASNALVTTNVFASNDVVIGPTPTTILANLHVERSDVFIGNSAVTGTVSDPGATSVYRLVFDNANRNTVTPNRIVLYSNSVSGNTCGLSMSTTAQTDIPTLIYQGGNHTFVTKSTTALSGYQAMVISSEGQINLSGSSSRAHLDISNGNVPASNVQVRIDSSNIALVTNGGLVGINTLTPTSTLHVTGNVYVSNALVTTNVFATTANVGTLNVWQISNLSTLTVTNNLYAANAVTTTNVFAATANVGTLNVWQISNLSTLTVTNNLYAANAVTTTNVFAATEILTGTTGQTTLNVTGNLYVSNAVTTTNITCAGFTSNVSNTIFNYDTFVIPFVTCTTLNVASTANVLTLSIPGSTGQTSLAVTGNVYASNAVTTTNLFAATGALTGAIGQTTLTMTTTGTGSNVFLFSNTAGPTSNNIVAMDSNAIVLIGISPSSNINYCLGYARTAKASLYVLGKQGGAGSSSYPINIVLSQQSAPGQTSYWNGIDFGGGGQGCVQIVHGPSGGGNGYLGFFFNNSNGSDGNISEGHRMTRTSMSINSAAASPTGGWTFQVSGNAFVSNALVTTNVIANTVTFIGTTGQTTANITGNVYASNAVTATTHYGNVSASNVVVTPATGVTGINVTGNIYASNAVSTTNVFASSVVPTYPISFRNRIINGDFIIDQRNAGASTTPGATPTRVIDRWNTETAGTGRCTVGQNLGAVTSPSGFTSYYGMRVTTTTTPGAGDYFFIDQLIEGINTVDLAWGTASAKPVTLSFWVYSSLSGTGGGFVRNAGESAGNYNRSYPFAYTINSTNTWEYKTVTIPGDTTGQWLSGQLDGVQVGFEMWNGTTYQGTAGVWAGANYTGPSSASINYAGTLNSNLYLTGVQFEAGLNASQYERRSIDFTLAQCQRYYEPSVARLGGYNTTGNFLRSSVYFNTKKRPKASPTFTVISTPESFNMGALTLDNSNFDQSSARILASVTATGDAYGQWKVAVDCEF